MEHASLPLLRQAQFMSRVLGGIRVGTCDFITPVHPLCCRSASDPRIYLILLRFLFMQKISQSHRGAFLKVCSMKCLNLKKKEKLILRSD